MHVREAGGTDRPHDRPFGRGASLGAALRGTRTLFEWDALSAAPTTVKIAPNESDEIAVLPGGSALTAQAVLRESTQRSIELASQTPTDDLSVFCLKMSDLKAQVENDGNDSLDRYDSMEIRIASGDETVLAREYRFVPHYAGDVRLCWWNTFGQIDYYTMRRPLAEGFAIGKERVLTAEGYAVTASRRESRLRLVSDYENEKTMRWLCGLLNAPKVWIAEDSRFVEADVLTAEAVVASDELSRIDMVLREAQPETFQNR